MVRIAKLLVLLLPVFVDIDIKNTSLIMSLKGKFIAELLSVDAKCLIMYLFVRIYYMFYHISLIDGSSDLKCLCKHSYRDHNCNSRKCQKAGCKCTKFNSKHGCACGLVYNDHETVFESREEREAEGRPVDPKWM